MRRRVKPARVVGQVFFWLLVAVIFVYLMFPFYWAIVSALKTQAELIRTPATLWPDQPVLTNFRSVLSNDRFVRAMGVSTAPSPATRWARCASRARRPRSTSSWP